MRVGMIDAAPDALPDGVGISAKRIDHLRQHRIREPPVALGSKIDIVGIHGLDKHYPFAVKDAPALNGKH